MPFKNVIMLAFLYKRDILLKFVFLYTGKIKWTSFKYIYAIHFFKWRIMKEMNI